ncbi:MAG: hypothetical protein IKS74_00765 [Methanomicrobium sp.]|nr:hypothetical protein [Methanomicrobium sp.]
MTESEKTFENYPRANLIEDINIKVQDIRYFIERMEKCCPDSTDLSGLTIDELLRIRDDLIKGEYLLEMFKAVMIDDDDWETIV